ncbi:MAG: ABC transporter ATP-binding protein [Endomicrobiales bacterium]|nr:ABC transporter ATP-binding protein [Endomicrobiales bacterium]
MLQISNLTKKFGKFTAVDDISFGIDRPGIIGLLGPNGAGKTTTIYLILGLINPTSGSIRIFGKDNVKHRQEVLSKMNFSSAFVGLPSNLKVRENLKFFSYLYNVGEWEKRADYLLERFQIRELKHKKAGELSSGQLTRLNLVKALLNDPCFLCLDEPTASLDPVSAKIVRNQLKEISAQEKMTILYTSHNMYEVEELCDEVIFLHKGKIKAKTTPKELMSSLKLASMENVFFELMKEEE